MIKIKKEIKLLYTFIILFIVCAFLLLFNIVLVLSNPIKLEERNFETISNSVVSIQTYTGLTQEKKGSGFIYKVTKDKAYILTNNHVIENTTNVKVFVTEDKSVDATMHGYDKYLDVAVLSIENNNYKALKINKDNKSNVGDIVYTMGTPLSNEFYNSTSSGIISKVSRLRYEENSDEQILMDMIQTNIITNPGNSGGPLFNEKLEVIGICTSNIEANNNTSGISFAVPIKHVMNKITELETKEEVSKRKISNTKIVDVKDSDELYKNNLIDITKEPYGVVVLETSKESPLKKGDIILEIDNKIIKDIDHYNLYINQYSKDTKVKLKIKRNDKEKTINVILE